ncbi:MAG: NusG domain II-containing protein [Lachnospiraceae bacterium]|nr:NusG domain II-containing protein [Lachnospiraceae bacterium]
MHKKINKYDFILILTFIIISMGFIIIRSLNTKDSDKVYVYVDGKLSYEYPLAQDITVNIEGYNKGSNILRIQDGRAWVEEASCRDKICVHSGQIHKSGQSIICLPNRVVISVSKERDVEYDAITR